MGASEGIRLGDNFSAAKPPPPEHTQNPTQDTQAEDRAYRIGQLGQVEVSETHGIAEHKRKKVLLLGNGSDAGSASPVGSAAEPSCLQ